MSSIKVGQFGDKATIGKRDAFHVPGIMVTASKSLNPSDNVRFVDKELTQVE